MSANFSVMRMEKLKSAVALTRALQHNARERAPLNADPDREPMNRYQGGAVADVMALYREKLPEKVRKNAVHAVEILLTASPGFRGNWDDYLKDGEEWARQLFGAGNVLHVGQHHDESTPHLHMVVMPLKDGKLNCKHFIGGQKDRMIELQNDFHEKVGKKHDLERGISKEQTKARHIPHTLAIKAAELDKERLKLISKELDISAKELKINKKEAELVKKEEKLEVFRKDLEYFKKISLEEVIKGAKFNAFIAKTPFKELKTVIELNEKKGFTCLADVIEAENKRRLELERDRGMSR